EQLAECRHSATEARARKRCAPETGPLSGSLSARRKAAEVQEELGSTREAKEQLQ
ncbi:unnamed protein product, partial [Effrenium voratum]